MDNENTNSKSEEWIERQLYVHLKKKNLNASTPEKIHLLQKRKRSRWWMLIINIAVILFFGYSFYFNITQLSPTLFYILCAVFIINMVLIYYQTTQLTQVIEYLQKEEH